MAGSKKAYWGGISVVTDTGWGDTGKGKIVDVAAQHVGMVVRYNGGPNSGHTVKNERGEFIFHGVPSGILNPEALCVIATGSVVNPIALGEEIAQLRQRGVKVSSSNLLISRDSHVIMPWHRTRDVLTEKARGLKRIGTTGQGIGPAYSDRAARIGLRVGDLLERAFEKLFDRELLFQERLARLMDKKQLLSELEGLSAGDTKVLLEEVKKTHYYDRNAILEEIKRAREILGPMITNTLKVIWNYQDDKKNILGEGAQGALLDLDLGGYPYVTSSHPGASGFTLATGIQGKDIQRVIGVTKAYSTRVGDGPLPTELNNDIGDYIQRIGHEVGATTGRKRRCGWLDIATTRYGARIAGVTSIALTKLDVLDGLNEVKLGVGYEVDGKQHRELTTADPKFMGKAKVIYETLPGWQQDTTIARSFGKLPINAQQFIHRIQELVGIPVEIVSVGADRSTTFYR